MQELEIDGAKYRTGQLNAFAQFHVFRKLTPVISGVINSFASISEHQQANGNAADEIALNKQFWSSIGPVAEALANMTQEDSEFVLHTCLRVVQRQMTQNQWVNITAPNGMMMFEDIHLGGMLQLTYAVLEDNLGDFFRQGLVSSLVGQSPTPSNG